MKRISCIAFIAVLGVASLLTSKSVLAQLIVPQQPAQQDKQSLQFEEFEDVVITPVVLKSITITGNQRISEPRILNFFDIKIGDVVDSLILNRGVRRLFRSGLFEDFQADVSPDGELLITVKENPIINRIVFEGNKAIKDEVLETLVNSRTRLAYSVNRIDSDVRSIQTAYRQSGHFAAIVRPVIIEQSQNRVDVVFEITEGNKTLVESINFIGNRFASDRELRDEMFTKTNDIISIIFGGDTYDPDKLNFDAENIRNYYLRHGFADFRILSTNSELDAAQQGFHITIAMEEGRPYYFGEFSVESSIQELDTEMLKSVVPFAVGDRFNNLEVQEALVRIENTSQSMGVPFIQVIPEVEKNIENQTIMVNFRIEPGLKRYVETININGNVRTLDYVIRRELEINEGDPISSEKVLLSERNLLNLGFFKSVEIIQRQGTNANDVVLDVQIQEKSTGAITLGLGLSTSTGAFARFGISEENFLGRGQKLAVSAMLGARNRTYDLSFTEPKFLERDLSASMRVYRLSDDGSSKRKYSYMDTGIESSFTQEVLHNWYATSSLQLSRNKIFDLKSDASVLTKMQKGTINKTTVSQNLFYDTRNSKQKPTSGFIAGGSIDFTGLVGNYKMLKTSVSGSWHMPLTDTVFLNISGSAAQIMPISGTELLISDNLMAGGETDIRGFQSSGIGPRVASTREALGGRTKVRGSVNLRLPTGLPKHVGLSFISFLDVGTVRNHGLKNTTGLKINSSGVLRASTGIGVQFDSQVPISIIFAKPLKKEDWDRTESFVFSLGTTF